ncbi:MAG: hypothetical protein AAF351_12550 [Pseudomonadota bacterium]
MARIEDLRLSDSGRKRRARMAVTGVVVFEEVDGARNEVELRVSFFGQDGRDDHRLANNVTKIVRGQSDGEGEGDHSTWEVNAISPSRSEFLLVRENDNSIWTGRTFNEDKPGRDEVFARAVVRDSMSSENLSEWARSNTVSGRY